MPTTRSRWLLPVVFLSLGYLAGGLAPARAGTTSPEGVIAKELEKIADALHELARREPVHVTCECK